MYESKDEMVSHPKHYQSKSGLEVIDVIEAFTDGLNGVEATDTGNIIKYACRWKQKNGIQDIEKIMWYTQHLIEYLEKHPENMQTKVIYTGNLYMPNVIEAFVEPLTGMEAVYTSIILINILSWKRDNTQLNDLYTVKHNAELLIKYLKHKQTEECEDLY